jgi:predicted nucleic acid-binding protein
MAGTIFLADASVYVVQGRAAHARKRFETLLIEGRLAACEMTALEWLNDAANPKTYEDLWAALHGHRWLDTTNEAMRRALDVHRMLGAKSRHRQFSLPDLIIAATAEVNGATVLHYDSDYDRIAQLTGQRTEWVVPKGSL